MEKQIKGTLEELSLEIPTQIKYRDAYYQKLIYATILKSGISVLWDLDPQYEYNILEQTTGTP